VERIVAERATIRQYIEYAQSLQTKYFNKGYILITYKISKKVLLLGKNITSRRSFKKLKNKFLGLFDVVERIRK